MVAVDPGSPQPDDLPAVGRGASADVQSTSVAGLTLACGRRISVQELSPLVEQIVKDGKFRQIGHGMEFRVYDTQALEGVVFKLASTSKRNDRLLLTSLQLSSKERDLIADELTQRGLAAPSVRVKVTIPVESCRTGLISERTVKVVVQQKLEAIEDCWRECRSNRGKLSRLTRDFALFHQKLLASGYIDADLNCIKNVGYVTKPDGTKALQLLDLGFVYRLPNERDKRVDVLASHGDEAHPTLGEFLIGSLFDRFYGNARKHMDVARVLKPLIAALFPGLTSEDMVAVHAAYIQINRGIKKMPRDQRVPAYMSSIRGDKHRQLIRGVLEKLTHARDEHAGGAAQAR